MRDADKVNGHGFVIRVCENAVMNDRLHQPTRNWVFALLGLLVLAIVVFFYVTGGKLPGTSNSPTSEIRGQTVQ
jgi:hypothetical protein